jgi:hypothetical protein
MLNKSTASLPSSKRVFVPGSCSLRIFSPLGVQRRALPEPEKNSNPVSERPPIAAHACAIENRDLVENQEKDCAAFNPGHSLFQEWFFFCRVKKIGDAPGTECIYVETVVDRDSGVAFAKVYPTRNAVNAVDILASRVVPFFQRQGIAIKEIHTRNMNEYFGLAPKHPYETFLATSHIQHLGTEQPGEPYNYLCQQFYRFLLKEFFPLALRRHFQLSLTEMQKELDAFVDAYNANQMKRTKNA